MRDSAPIMQQLEARRLLAQTGFWTFDDGSGATAIDSSGSNTNAVGYKMTLSGAPAWQSTGVDGGSLAFSTATQYGDAGPLPGSAATLSVSLWFNASSLKNQTLVDKLPNDASGAGWALKLRSDGSLWFRIGSASNFTDVKVTGAYSAGSWTAVAATFTGGTAALFVNGQSRATQGGITQSVPNATTPLRVAVPSASSTTETFAGAIDDLRLWDQAISPTSIAREYAVDPLPAATTANRLKKADLQWAVEDALADEAYGNASSAASTYADVLTMLGQNIGNAQPSPANLFPAIPSASTNPILTDALVKLNKLRTNYARLDKNPATFTTTVASNSPLSAYGGYYADGLNGAWALGDPQTSLYGDPKLLQATLRRFERVYSALNAGYGFADFGQSSEIAQMYLMFKTVYPDLLLPSKQTAWEAALKKDADKILADHSATYLAAKPGVLWVNSDVRYAATLGYDALIFPSQTAYAAAGNAAIKTIAQTVYPDGGMPYIDWQNEDFTYHGINIATLARYWQITGNADAQDAVIKSYWYYPLTIEPSGVVSYSTMPAWKHYWNAVKSPDAAYLVGTMARSPENRAVFQQLTGGSFAGLGTLELASFYDPSVSTGSVHDNYITYDRNDLGPRGRFGNWSFTGTANPITGQTRGVASFVGAMLTDAGSSSSWPLNAALDSAQTRVEFANGQEKGAPNQAGLFYDLANNVHASTTITDHFTTLASVYNASKYGSTSSANWIGQQEWIYTAQRIVGLVSMRSTATQSAYDVEGILKLVSGRGSWGNVRSFSISTDPDGITRYTYGNLSVRIIAQNYGGIYTDYVDTMNAGEDTPSGKMGRIRFIDQQALANGGFDPNDTLNTQLDLKPTTYTTATNHYYMVEILPATTAAAASVTADGNPLSTGVRGIDLTENGHAYRLIDNPTSTPKTYTTTINWTGGATVHTAGETYRPDWLGTYSNTDTDFRGRAFGPTTAFDVPAGTFTYTIPAYGHIVLESNAAPTLATPTIAPAPVVGRPSTLSVVGADDGGASALTYSWSVLGDSTGVSFGNANGTPAGQAISIQFTRPGTYTLQVTATDAGGLSAANTLQVVVPPPPQVTAVTVTGTNWNSSFLSYLTTHHLGTNGYAISSDPTQASPLPWNNIDTIRLTFDQSVNVGIGDLVLQGVRIPAYAIKSFSYDSTSATASWTLNGPIPADRLHLDLAQSVGNDANGTLGSDFVFDFNVLPGDAARAPSVLANSLLLVRNAQFATTASTAYSIFYDINANGQILADDLLLVRNAQFNTLPTPV